MSCKVKYKNETYSLEEFRNLVEGNPEEFSEYTEDLGISKSVLPKAKDPYSDISKMKFEEKEQIIRDSGAKLGKYGYYYHLNKEQQKQYDNYNKVHKNAIPGATKQGFELSKDRDRNVYLKKVRGKNYLYIDLKHLVNDDGVFLPKVYGQVKFPIDLIFNSELEKYLQSFEEEKPFISEQEAVIRRILFKTKGVSAAKAANFYLFNIKDALIKLIKDLGGDVIYSDLNNMSDETIERIKSLANIDLKVEQIVKEYKETIENMDDDEIRQQVASSVSDAYDPETLQGIWKLINYLPTSFLRLLAFDYVDDATAFFKADDEKNLEKKIPNVRSVTNNANIILGTSFNVALRKMHDDGFITDEDVNIINKALRKEIDKNLVYRKDKIVAYDELRRMVQRSKFIKFKDKAVEYKGKLELLSTIFIYYQQQAMNDITEYTSRQNKGLVEVVDLLKRMEHKRLNTLFTNITLGKLDEVEDNLKFPVDYTVITAHELGHALDYYLQTTKPKEREKLNYFINYLTSLPEFKEYLDKGLHSRGYQTSNTKEIAADLYAWLMAKGAGYDISKSHITTLDQFMQDNAAKVEQIFKEVFEIKSPRKEADNIIDYIKDLIDDLKEWVNKTLGTEVFATSKGEVVNEEGAMQRLLEGIHRLTMRDDTFDVENIMNSETQREFFKHLITPEQTFDTPALTEEKIKKAYKPIELYQLEDGTIVIDRYKFEVKASKIAEQLKKEYGLDTLRGIVSFEKLPSKNGGTFTVLRINKNGLNQKQTLFDTPVKDISDALQNASVTKEKLDQRMERMLQESNKIYKIVNKIDNKSIQTSVREAINNLKDPAKAKEVSNFAYLIIEAKETLGYYADRLQKIKELNTKEQIAEIGRVKTIADAFTDLIKFLQSDFRYVPNTNEFKQIISDLAKSYQEIQTINSTESFDLAIEVMTQDLAPDAKIALKKLTVEKDNLVNQKEKALAIGAGDKFLKKIDDKIKEVDRKIRSYVPDRENLENIFKGLSEDLGWIPGNLRSALAQGDPIVSGFARRLKRGYDAIRRALMPLRDEAYDQLTKYQRELGLSPNSTMAKFYEGLYDIQQFREEDIDGNLKDSNYYTLLSPFKESFYNEIAKYQYDIKKIKKAGEDPSDVEKKYRDFLGKYGERKYKDAWYDRYDLLIPEAEEARDEIITEIRNILKGNNNISEQDAQRIYDLKHKLKRLGSKYDETGKPKTGKGLEIAESMQAFSRETAKMSNWVITDENRAWFNAVRKKKEEQVKLGQISKESYDNWFRLNTQRLISPEFYDERGKLVQKISDLMSKLPKEQFREDMKDLWDKVINIAKPYRDEDNVLDGTEAKDLEKSEMKKSEDAIEEIKRKLIRFSGLSLSEEQELAGLWYSVESLTPKEVKRFTELKDRKFAYKRYIGSFLSDTEFKALMTTFSQLAAMQSRVPTEYYRIEFNKELHKFREKVDPDFQADIEDVQELFERDSEWFKNNHVLVTRKVIEDDSVEYIDKNEPLYIWTDTLPTNEKYIEHDAPGFAYRTRIVKPEFLNVNHQVDVKDRILPKKYIQEKGQTVLNPYVNEKYEDLKNATDSRSQAKFQMLDFLRTVHLQEQENLPTFKRLGNILPGNLKTGYDRTLEGGIQGIKTGVKNLFTKTQEDKDLTLGDMSQVDLSIIPLKFSTAVKPEDQNLNLLESVLQHRAAIEEYKFLDSEINTANVIKEALKTGQENVSQSAIDKVLERTGLSRFIKPDKESRRSRVFNEFVRTYFYGEHEVSYPDLIPGINTNKLLGNVLGLSSVQLMILNIPAHITNVVSGEIQNMIEANAKRYFTWSDYLRAKVTYIANVGNFWNDYSKEGGKSKWSAIIDHFDVPQGEFMDHFGKKTAFSRIRDFKNNLMIIKQTGEHEIQVTTMMAMMENYKVDLNGNTVPLYDALDYKDGEIRIKNGATVGGEELTEADLDMFEDRVHSVLRQLNGAYSKLDKTLAEKTLLGKLAFYMRKYFMPMYFRRFETFKYDYEERDFKEGYYITTVRLIKDLVTLNAQLVKNWSVYKETLSPEERLNVRRFMAEVSIIAILGVAILLIGGYDNDRELKGRWLYTMTLYQLMKAKSEAETQLPLPGLGVNELTSIFSSPFAAASTAKIAGRSLSDLGNWVIGSSNARFKRDYGVYSEGDIRWMADVLKLTGVNVNLATPENFIKNFELRNR